MPTTRNFYLSQIVSEALELLAQNKKKSSRFKQISIQLGELEPMLKKEDPLKVIINSFIKASNNA